MRKRTLAIALGALLTATAIAAAPTLAQSDYGYSYSYTTTYPGTTTYYSSPPVGLGGVGVYVRPGPYVPPPATTDPSFIPQVAPSTAYVAPGTTSTTTYYTTPAPAPVYVAPGTTYYTPNSTTTIYTTR